MKKLVLKDHTATLESMNIRMTNPDKGPQLVADLKLTTKTDAKNLSFLSASLYDRSGVPRLSCEDEIHWGGKLEHYDLFVKHSPNSEARYHDITVRRFVSTLLPNKRAELCFTASIKLSGKKIGELSERISMPLSISLEPQPHLFDKKGIRRGKAEAKKLGMVPAKALKAVSEGKQENGKNKICPECKKPITKDDTSVQLSAMDKKSPWLHSKCFDKRANRALKKLKSKGTDGKKR